MDNTIFSLGLKAIHDTIMTLLSHEEHKGINVTNWSTQIFSNNPINYAFTIRVTYKDNTSKTYKTPAKFQPAGNGDSEANKYLRYLSSPTGEKMAEELFSLFGYLFAGIVLGKQLAVVNSGRGLILEKTLSKLNLMDMTITIEKFTSGGTDEKHDVIITFPEIKAWIKPHAIRAESILKLPERKDKRLTSDTSQFGNRKDIVVMD